MPRISPTGLIVMGVAGEAMSIDGSTPAALSGVPSGGWDWVTDTIAMGPAEIGSWDLYQYDTVGLTLTNISPYAGNSTVFKAGGNNWASWVLDSGITYGVRTSIPAMGTRPAGYVLGVSRQGEFGFVIAYLADSGIQLFDNGGTLIDQINGTLQYNDRLFVRDGVCTYALTGQGWRIRDYRTATNLSLLLRNDGVDQCVPIVDGSDIWFFERNNIEQITLRLKDSTTAFLVGAAAVNQYLYLDAILLSPGVVRLAWANTVGELPDSLFAMDVTLATGANDLGTVVAGALVFTPQAALGMIAVTGSIIPGGGGGGGIPSPGSGNQGKSVIAARTALPPPVKVQQKYPHVPEIKDFAAKQSTKLLWDQANRLGDTTRTLQATVDTQAETIAALRRAVADLARRSNVAYQGVTDDDN